MQLPVWEIQLYRRMVYAETRETVEHARVSFLRKWQLRCKAVVSSLEEAGDELFTFLQFPLLHLYVAAAKP